LGELDGLEVPFVVNKPSVFVADKEGMLEIGRRDPSACGRPLSRTDGLRRSVLEVGVVDWFSPGRREL
jgi:hypothetical protein